MKFDKVDLRKEVPSHAACPLGNNLGSDTKVKQKINPGNDVTADHCAQRL